MCNDDIDLPEKNKKGKTTLQSYRAGTNFTYNKKIGKGTNSKIINSKNINDIAYIKPEDKGVYTAISLETGFTALGETAEDAYSCLVFKLYDALRAVVDLPNPKIGQAVSKALRGKSKHGTRMPQDRQLRALLKGIEEFLSIPRKNSKLSDLSFKITTPYLENTIIDVNIDTFEPSKTRKRSPQVQQES